MKTNFMLFRAIEDDNVKTVKDLLNKHKYQECSADVNACQPEEEGGAAALHVACQLGRLKILEIMLADPAIDINARNNEFKAPVHIAAEFGHLAILKILRRFEVVRFDLEDCERSTPLHKAAHHGHEPCVRFIISDPTADPSKKNKFGETALDLASTREIEEVSLRFL